MTDENMELIQGGGNVFRDSNLPNPEVDSPEAILAANVIGIFVGQKLTVRREHELTGFAAADFSWVRQAELPVSPSIV